MKKIVLGFTLALTAASTYAVSDNATFIAQDGSIETNLCITAATKGYSSAKHQAINIDNLSAHQFSLTNCNGQPIKTFAQGFLDISQKTMKKAVKAIPANQASESRLCARAANVGLVALASESRYTLRNINCNGQNIIDFARANNS
ncbi:hypothetical protein Q4489_15850 [Thalassotalea sp. 1_MG-2023]|uniref:hypothetical protein n=1 Tax=Thalassotalea sp. 1_MG-2023 TaxID=3062680 RepID=UPI0026E39429|nr:hypothetical protein [Thalassotalea sp. 1_MG-2023]MDO6428488.1 hypothetical protein [Thalassotalea sp. 1_MG-2023]